MKNLSNLAEALEYSGYADGEKFESEGEVRDYFSYYNFIDMFGECHHSSSTLRQLADYVIKNRLHCEF